jgi:amidase
MAKSAEDCGILLKVMAGKDVNDPTCSLRSVPHYAQMSDNLKEFTVGVDRSFLGGCDDGVLQVLEDTILVLKEKGAIIKEVNFPDSSGVLHDWAPSCAVETAYAHRETYPARKAEYHSNLANFIELGRSVSAFDLQEMLLRRADFRGRVETSLNNFDVLLIPAIPFDPVKRSVWNDAEKMKGMMKYTGIFNASGHPSITFPAGFCGKSSVPLGMQFVARNFGEGRAIRAAHAFQSITDFHLKPATNLKN